MTTGRGRRVRFSPKPEEPTPASAVPSLGPVAFTLEFSGRSESFDLSDLPCPRLTRSLARALAEIGGDGGTRRYLDGYKQVIACVSRFVRFIAEAEQERGEEFDIDDLEPMILSAFEATLVEQYGQDSAWPHRMMSQIVFVIRRAYEHDPDSLTEEMRGRVNYSSSHAKGRDQPLDAYPFPVMDRIESAALADIREILNRIHRGEQLAMRGMDPADGRWWLKPEDVMHHIANHGPLTSEDKRIWTIRDVMGGIRAVNSQLFLTFADLVPFHILLICQTGLEPDCVKALQEDCLINPSRGFVGIAYTKKRGQRGDARKSIRVADGGSPSHPGGLIKLVQRLTHRARAICGTESLWAVVDNGYVARPAFDRRRDMSAPARDWMSRQGLDTLVDRDGSPVRLDLRRLRKTFKSRQYVRAGGVLADFASGHTKSVAARHYADIDAHRELHEQAVETGLEEALAVAISPPVVLDELGARIDAGEQPLTPQEVSAALSGENDVFLASCRDFFASPFSRKPGEPCPVPVWGCLECPNAVYTTRHLPSVLSFLGFIEDERNRLSAAEWRARYDASWQRIVDGIRPKFTDDQIIAAKAIAEAGGLLLTLPSRVLETIS